MVEQLRAILWDILPELEELSPATSSAMVLLAQLHSPPAALAAGSPLAALLPRLWPFYQHALSGVRRSSLQCTRRLVEASCGGSSSGEWLVPVLGSSLRLVFQALVMESEPGVRAEALAAWRALVLGAGVATLAAAVDEGGLRAMLALAATPLGQPLDARLLVAPAPGGCGLAAMRRPDGGGGSAAAAPPRAKRARLGAASSGTAAARESEDGAGPGPHIDLDMLVGADGPEEAIRTRLAAAEALGALWARVHGQVRD